jgi:dTDP-4-dehydrorhamnose reductase
VKTLVIASNPQFIDALSERFTLRGRPLIVAGIGQCASDAELKTQLQSSGAELVVNATGYDQGADFNYFPLDAVERLAKLCKRMDLPLLQLSSSQVFDGLDGGRHREHELATPASRAGALLWRVEEAVRSHPRHLILRTGPVFSAQGDNLLTRLLNDFRRGGVVERATAGQCCPTWVGDLARVVSAIIDQLACDAQCWGTYHYCSSDPVSSYQFAETTLALVSQYLDTSALEISLEIATTMDVEWPRPLLNCDKIRNTFGIKQLPWRSSISSVVQQSFAGETDEQSPGE